MESNKILLVNDTFEIGKKYYVKYKDIEYIGSFINCEIYWEYVPYNCYIFDTFVITNGYPGPIYINTYKEINITK